MKNTRLANSATVSYNTQANGINAVTVSGGASVTLAPGEKFVDIAYGNSTLYGLTKGDLYTVNVSTGALTRIARIEGGNAVSVYSSTQLLVVRGNSLLLVTIATGAYTYLKQNL